MALTYDFHISAYQADCSTNTVTEDTVYGNGEAERDTMANYIIGAKMDVDETPTYIDVVNDAPLNTSGSSDLDDYVPSEWIFPTAKDGWYRFNVLSIPLYSNAVDYVVGSGDSDVSIVYDASEEQFYRCIQNNGPGSSVQAVTETAYWQLLDYTDNEAFVPFIDNTTLIASTIYDDLVTCYGEDCLVRELQEAVKAGLCKDCKEYTDIKSYHRVDILINGALAKNYQDKMAEAEEIMRFVEDFCSSC